MSTPTTNLIHGLTVLTPAEALAAGYEAITTGIHAVDEKAILASVCQHRDPKRTCLIQIAPDYYELAIPSTDIRRERER